MGEACGMIVRYEKQNFSQQLEEKRPCHRWGITLKWILKKWGVRMGTGFFCPRIGSIDSLK
jgi:hypothetical protein